MRFAVVYSRTVYGINAHLVTIEAHLAPGLPGFFIVGLPETAIKESRERIRSAILNSGFSFPSAKIIINLAPADIPKEGAKFDLPIAISILVASQQIANSDLSSYEFSGELALNGELRKITKALPIALAVKNTNRNLVLPKANKQDFLPSNVNISMGETLLDVCSFLDKRNSLTKYNFTTNNNNIIYDKDFADVYGQEQAKRALSIACAGNHNILMVGPPGTGKTMLASGVNTILPALAEVLEVASVYDIKNSLEGLNNLTRPFRSPHHGATLTSIIGGGANPKPGEISLAHKGVLFLDELPEFDSKVIDSLREPLEDKSITIARAKHTVKFPANFLLIAAMNPCPCGNYGVKDLICRCTTSVVQRYINKISGPILDRIDLKINLPKINSSDFLSITDKSNNTCSKEQLTKVVAATKLQKQRANKLNSEYNNKDIQQYCVLAKDCQNILFKAIDKFKLPDRTCHKIIKVARTIADMNGEAEIDTTHISEAISFNTILQ